MLAPPPGLEPALLIDRPALSWRKEMVVRFYKDMWDHADVSIIPEHSIQASRSAAHSGRYWWDAQFSDYVRWVTDALKDHPSEILGMIEERDQVSGRIRFHGIHRRTLVGQSPSCRHVWWHGVPVFTFEGAKVSDLWFWETSTD